MYINICWSICKWSNNPKHHQVIWRPWALTLRSYAQSACDQALSPALESVNSRISFWRMAGDSGYLGMTCLMCVMSFGVRNRSGRPYRSSVQACTSIPTNSIHPKMPLWEIKRPGQLKDHMICNLWVLFQSLGFVPRFGFWGPKIRQIYPFDEVPQGLHLRCLRLLRCLK